jgi:hypothetical protein
MGNSIPTQKSMNAFTSKSRYLGRPNTMAICTALTSAFVGILWGYRLWLFHIGRDREYCIYIQVGDRNDRSSVSSARAGVCLENGGNK